MLGERAEQGLVERPHWQGGGDAVQQVGMDGRVGAGDEDQREQDELHDCWRGFGVADKGGHRDAEGAELAAPSTSAAASAGQWVGSGTPKSRLPMGRQFKSLCEIPW